jgi:hypothetical protein
MAMPDYQPKPENPNIRDPADHAIDPTALEEHQPDPMLQMSSGRMRAGGISLVALAIIIVVAAVLYGLNGHGPTAPTGPTPANPPAASNSAGGSTPTSPQTTSPGH